MTKEIEKSPLELDFAELIRRKFTPLPAAWEDRVLYFLLVDRFSDHNEVGAHHDNDGRPITSVPARHWLQQSSIIVHTTEEPRQWLNRNM